MLYVFDPDISRQAAQDHNIPKHAGLIPFMIHLAGPGERINGQKGVGVFADEHA